MKELTKLLTKYSDIVVMDEPELTERIKQITESKDFKYDFLEIVHKGIDAILYVKKMEEEKHELRTKKEIAQNTCANLRHTISGIAEAQYLLESMVKELKLIKTGLK